MADFYLRKNDTSPAIRYYLQDHAGNPLNLVGGSVRFHMADQSGTTKVDAAATVEDEDTAEVSYAWAATDTDTAGSYIAEWEITYSDGTVETVPNDGYLSIQIQDDLG